jgi:hypothetical protein
VDEKWNHRDVAHLKNVPFLPHPPLIICLEGTSTLERISTNKFESIF